MHNIIRHGDVSFYPTELPKTAKLVKKTSEFTFAFGETTGHNHTMVAEPACQFKVMEVDGQRYYVIDAPVKLTHPEHKTIILDPGTYIQNQEQEKDWFSLSVRKVID